MVDLSLLTATSGSVRAVNTARVLTAIREAGPISRSELIERSGLSKATVSGIVASLLERDAVRETGKFQQGRGRSRILLEFNSAAMTVIGVQIADDRCQFVRTDLAGAILDRHQASVDLSDVSRVPTAVARHIRRIAERPGGTVLGVGVGVPGVVDPTGRHVTVALSHDWHGVDLAEDLERALGLPVTLANRAKVAALGQVAAMVASGPRVAGVAAASDSAEPAPGSDGRPADDRSGLDLVYLYLGSGVIAGIVIGGRLHSGHDGTAGDLGHVTVDPKGPRCACGTRGCLQVLVGGDAVLAASRRATWADLVDAVEDGDADALAVVRRTGDHLGVPLGHLAAAVTPSVIAIGGPTAQLGAPLLAAVDEAVRRSAPMVSPVDIIRADDDAAPRGAAMLWMQRAGLLT